MSDPILLVLMTLAAYRLWRIPGNDDWPPSRWLRGQIEVRADQWRGVADDSETREDNLRAWLWAELKTFIECPWCLGFWIAGAVVLIIAQLTSIPMPLLWWFAVACGVGLIGTVLDG